MKVGKVIAKK